MEFDFPLYEDFIYDILRKSLSQHDPDQIFDIHWIEFFNRSVGIIMQPFDGACPLIAITNGLSLRNDIAFPFSSSRITLSEIVLSLTNYLLNFYKSKLENTETSDLFSLHIQEAVEILPGLMSGLDVNCKFENPKAFELTGGISLFDTFNMEILHGWLPPPEDEPTYSFIVNKSYNQLVERAIAIEESNLNSEIKENKTNHEKSPASTTEASNSHQTESVIETNSGEDCIQSDDSQGDKKKSSSNNEFNEELACIHNFLDNSKSQLTSYGLYMLHQVLRERQIAALFRNNHFSTIFKFKGQIYLLATDPSFMESPPIVWEILNSIDGNTCFIGGNFESEPQDYLERSKGNQTPNQLQQEKTSKKKKKFRCTIM